MLLLVLALHLQFSFAQDQHTCRSSGLTKCGLLRHRITAANSPLCFFSLMIPFIALEITKARTSCLPPLLDHWSRVKRSNILFHSSHAPPRHLLGCFPRGLCSPAFQVSIVSRLNYCRYYRNNPPLPLITVTPLLRRLLLPCFHG